MISIYELAKSLTGDDKNASQDKVGKVMREFKAGKLKSSDGKVVEDRKQAVAIAMSEAGLSKGRVSVYDLAKGGEGSRGGKIIGHTQSGKPIYDQFDHPAHGSFNEHDHFDAGAFHIRQSNEKIKQSMKLPADSEQGKRVGKESLDYILKQAHSHYRAGGKSNDAWDTQNEKIHSMDEKSRDHAMPQSWHENLRKGGLINLANLAKALGGEGSRGGKVIGHTKSGKPVYDREQVKHQYELFYDVQKNKHYTTHVAENYKEYSSKDHEDAMQLHEEHWKENRDKATELQDYSQKVLNSRDRSLGTKEQRRNTSAEIGGRANKYYYTAIHHGDLKEAHKKQADIKRSKENYG